MMCGRQAGYLIIDAEFSMLDKYIKIVINPNIRHSGDPRIRVRGRRRSPKTDEINGFRLPPE